MNNVFSGFHYYRRANYSKTHFDNNLNYLPKTHTFFAHEKAKISTAINLKQTRVEML